MDHGLLYGMGVVLVALSVLTVVVLIIWWSDEE